MGVKILMESGGKRDFEDFREGTEAFFANLPLGDSFEGTNYLNEGSWVAQSFKNLKTLNLVQILFLSCKLVKNDLL